MKRNEALAAIEAILAAIDDHELPKPRMEHDAQRNVDVAWFGSHGYHIGSCRDGNGNRKPGGSHRKTGAWDALEQEAIYRLDLAAGTEVSA